MAQLELNLQQLANTTLTNLMMASINQTGYWGHDESLFKKRIFEITDMWQTMIGLPVMNLVWNYKTIEITPNPLTHALLGWDFLEPEILIFEESK